MLGVAHRLPYALKPLMRVLRRPVKYRHQTPIDLTIWGLKLRLMPRGNLSEQKLYSAPQLFDRMEFAVMRRLLEPGAVMVDVGANAGAYSLWAHHCMAGRGRIIAVEPDPEMRRRLGYNIATNSLTTIEVHPIALSDHEGSAILHVNERQRGANSLERKDSGREGLRVPVTSLVGLLERCGVEKVDVLKLDIEGHETVVLGHFISHVPERLLPRAVICEFKPETRGEIEALMGRRQFALSGTSRQNFIFERS